MVNKNENEEKHLRIGYIMPISDVEPYKNGHWKEVKGILDDTINNLRDVYEDYEIENFIVSEITGNNPIILKSIVSNIYKCDLVICDVSSRNPNVMFELGMRLAFDKKIIIIKDEITPYSFDTSVINHLEYEKDLNYIAIKRFQRELELQIKTTLDSSNTGSDNAGYLDSFADIKIQTMNDHSVQEAEAIGQILEKLERFDLSLSNLEKRYYPAKDVNKKSLYSNYMKKSELINESIKLREEELDYFADIILGSILESSDKNIGELSPDVEPKIIIEELSNINSKYLNKSNVLNIQNVLREKIRSSQVEEG